MRSLRLCLFSICFFYLLHTSFANVLDRAPNADSITWDGVWLDKCDDNDCYGGTTSICRVDDLIYGRYSNIGFFIGKVTKQQVIGRWYEAGYSQRNHGGFEFRVIAEDRFTGSWWINENRCERKPWSSVRLPPVDGDDSISSEECGFLVTQFEQDVFQGEWIAEDGSNNALYFCQDFNNRFHASGKINDVDVYVAGMEFEFGRVLSGSVWNSANPASNIMLVTVIEADEIVVSYFNAEVNEQALGRFSEPNSNFVVTYRKRDNIALSDLQVLCQGNENIGQLKWQGAFEDSRHGLGLFQVCPNVNDNGSTQGIYSELGWIEASIQDKLLFGEYYNAGARRVDEGSFQLELVNNGHSFQGFYTINGFPVEWTEDRVDATNYYSKQCLIVPEQTQGVMSGRWYYGKNPGDIFDICVYEDGEVEISYSYNGDTDGYAIGEISKTSASARVQWYEDSSRYGVSMLRLEDSDHLVEVLWARVRDASEIYYNHCKNNNLNAVNFEYYGRHAQNRLLRLSPFVNRAQCNRNQRLFNSEVYTDQYDNDAARLIGSGSFFVLGCLLLVQLL